MSEDIKLEVVVNGVKIPIKINPEEEVLVKKVVTEINSKLIELRKSFDIGDKDRVYTMALLSYAMELEKSKAEYAEMENANSSISDRLDSITQKIVNALK